ncbi:GNAT family N-acetyltransferase [Bosea sp. 2KB_26]|uniref:GNAT family N-acetyltransferase n=1 Tax=Bosea sp. 2KB_26 TaxID=3237475 RepID=UPI000DE386FE
MAEAGDIGTALLGKLGCDDVRLRLSRSYSPDTSLWRVAAYRFDVLAGDEPAGTISLRPGASYLLTHLAGQIGFSIEPACRGRGLAGKAVKALLPLAKACGLTELWLTTTPDNLASRRTLERLGCALVEEVTIPEDYESYARGERLKLRYRLELG